MGQTLQTPDRPSLRPVTTNVVPQFGGPGGAPETVRRVITQR